MADIESENEINEEIKEEETACETEEVSQDETEAETSPNEAEEAEEEDKEEGEPESEEDESGQIPKKERKLNWAKMGKAPAKESKEDILNAQLAEEKDKYARLFAEFDNFRKRNEKEKEQMYDFGAKAVIEKILPVIDNFERGLAALSDEEKEGAFAMGMEKTYKQFLEILDAMGVKPIEALGCEFNPALHNAVMHEDNEEVGENIITQEFQKGYTYKEKLVRPSMVKVAN